MTLSLPEQFEQEFGNAARVKWFGTDGPLMYPLMEELYPSIRRNDPEHTAQYLEYERRILEAS